MANDENIEGVGLGVDLKGGVETLKTLQAIRVEMEAIARLSGRAGGSTTGQDLYGPSAEANAEQFIRAREKMEMESIKRVARARAEAGKEYTQAEIDQLAAQQNRKLELNRKINQRAQQLEREHQAELTRIQREAEAQRQRQVIERRQRVSALSNEPDILSRDPRRQAQAFQRYRNDPARDAQTNQYRRDLADEISAQRNFLREKARLVAEQERLAIREAKTQEVNLGRPFGPDRGTFNARNRQIANVEKVVASGGADQFDNPLLINTAEARLYRQLYGNVDKLKEAQNKREQELDAIAEKARVRQQQRDYVQNQRANQVAQAEKSALAAYPNALNAAGQGAAFNPNYQLPANVLRGGSGFRPNGRGPVSFGGGGGRQPTYNPNGLIPGGDALGRITRNILLYEVVSRASYGLVEYVSKSLEAAKSAVDFGNALRFATEQAGGNVASNEKLADSLTDVGLSRNQGRQAVIEAARFTEGRSQDTEQLTRVATDIAATRGFGVGKTGELIDQLRDQVNRPESKFYEQIFGTSVKSIYQDYAAKQVAKQTTNPIDNAGLYIGTQKTDIKSTTEQVKAYVTAMTDAEKKNAVLNYILAQSNRFQGEASERAQTLAGRLDKLDAVWANNQENLGLFITDLKVVGDLLDSLTSKVGILGSLKAPTLGRSGPNGEITDADVRQFGIDRTTGFRANALSAVNNYGGAGLLGIAGLAGSYLFGRQPARVQTAQDTYQSTLSSATTAFRGDAEAARGVALAAANNARPTLLTTIKAGMNRITGTIESSFTGSVGYLADQVGANKLAQQSRIRAAIASGTTARPAGLSEEEFNALKQQRAGAGSAIGSGIGAAGGGYAGAVIGSFVADKITSNSIVATGITILGGAIGSGVGSALGSAVGGALGGGGLAGAGALLAGSVGAAGAAVVGGTVILGTGAGYAIGSAIEPAISKALNLPAYQQRLDEEAFQRLAASSPAFSQQAQQLNDATAKGQVRFRDARTGELLTGAEVARRGDAQGDSQGGFTNYARVLIDKSTAEFTQDFGKKISDILDTVAPSKERTEQIKELRRQQGESLVRGFNVTDPANAQAVAGIEDYRADAAKRQLEFEARNQKERDERISETANAFAKLRNAEQGAFRLPQDIGTSLTGEDNPYTKVLADQISLAERMTQQWGFLGKAAVEYFTKVEQRAIDRQLNRAEFQTYTQASNLRLQAGREVSQRNGPGLSRREQDFLDVQSAITNAAQQIPGLYQQAAAVRGGSLSPGRLLQGSLNLIGGAFGVNGPVRRNVYGQVVSNTDNIRRNVYGQTVGGTFDVEPRRNVFGQILNDPAAQGVFDDVGQGQSEEVKKVLRKNLADTYLDAFKNFSPAQIRASGYQDLYLAAVGQQGRSLGDNIEDARKKAQLGAEEDERLNSQLRADERFRAAQIAAGRNPADVGRESDALLLARTEGVNPKDLSYQQFSDRQAALRRTAERTEQEKQEAQDAVNQGLAYQAEMNANIAAIRAALVNGDASVLVQVQNDTQARVDQDVLQNMAQPTYKDVKNFTLDQSQEKTNPYSDSFTRYGRGGRK